MGNFGKDLILGKVGDGGQCRRCFSVVVHVQLAQHAQASLCLVPSIAKRKKRPRLAPLGIVLAVTEKAAFIFLIY